MSMYGGHKEQLGLDEEQYQQTGPVQCPSPGGLQSDINRVLSKAKTWRLQALLN